MIPFLPVSFLVKQNAKTPQACPLGALRRHILPELPTPARVILSPSQHTRKSTDVIRRFTVGKHDALGRRCGPKLPEDWYQSNPDATVQ